jgi:hypothetical protein
VKTFVLCLYLLGLPQPLGQQAFAVRRQQQRPGSPQPGMTSHGWRAGTFKGLTVGRATRRDMLRLLGNPARSEPMGEGQAATETWYHYPSADPPGDLVVAVERRGGLILRIDLYPESLSKEEAVRRFGDGFIVTRYDFDNCLGGEEAAPLYESPDGPLVRLEYRGRGIAIAVNSRGQVDHISYVRGPLGAPSSKCQGGKRGSD